MKKKMVSLLAVVLMTGVAYGDVGDVWSLSGDMQNVNNPSLAIDPGVAGGGTGTWEYRWFELTSGATPVISAENTLFDPAVGPSDSGIPNKVNVHVEVPNEGIGWVRDDQSHFMLVKFTIDADPNNANPDDAGDEGDKTNFVAGDVGGHTGFKAIWTSDHPGFFTIDYLGYNARNQALAGTGEQGRQTRLKVLVNGVEIVDQVITGGQEDGSANAFTGSEVVELTLAGQTIEIWQWGTEWAGADLLITEVPTQPICANRPSADLDNNCWVDLEDLKLLAEGWLDCGILNLPSACFQ